MWSSQDELKLIDQPFGSPVPFLSTCAGIVFDAHHSLGRDDAGVSEVSGQVRMDFHSPWRIIHHWLVLIDWNDWRLSLWKIGQLGKGYLKPISFLSNSGYLHVAPCAALHGQKLCDRLRDGQRPRGLSNRFTSDSTLARHHHCDLDSCGVYRRIIKFQRSMERHAQFKR